MYSFLLTVAIFVWCLTCLAIGVFVNPIIGCFVFFFTFTWFCLYCVTS